MEGKKSALGAESKMIFRFPDKGSAEAAFKSLKDEGNISKRCKSETSLNGSKIIISIVAEDCVSFRATVNGFLRALQVFESVEMITK